jgi:hypothetical protein
VSSWTDAFGRWNGGCTHAATNIKNGHTGNERKTIHSPPDAELDRIRTGFGLAAGANLTITGVKPTDIPDPTEGGVLAISAGSARPVRASSTRRRNSRPSYPWPGDAPFAIDLQPGLNFFSQVTLGNFAAITALLVEQSRVAVGSAPRTGTIRCSRSICSRTLILASNTRLRHSASQHKHPAVQWLDEYVRSAYPFHPVPDGLEAYATLAGLYLKTSHGWRRSSEEEG